MTSSLHYATLWEEIADRIPDLPALRHLDVVRSWAEFDTRSACLGGGLLAHGIGRDDGVAAFLYNCPEYFELFFGTIKIRGVPSNVNYRYSSDELLALLENSGAKALFFDVSLADRVAAVADRADAIHLLVEVGGDGPSSVPGAVTYEELLQADPAARVHRDETDVFLSYTGGTTGLPKGVLFDIGESAANSIFIRNLFLGLDADAPGPVEFAVSRAAHENQMRAIPASPLMHSTGFFFASLPTLTAGGMATTLEHHSFDAHELLQTIARTRTQVVAIVGDAFAIPIVRALDEGRPGGGSYDVGSLQVFTSAGVAWSAHIKERLLEHLPEVVLFDSCGSTEGVFYGIRTIRKGDSLSTANFDAAPGLKVLSPERLELPPGEIGMLANTTTATGYHRDPEKTARTYFHIDGVRYATPGDLGRIETDGTVTLIGRGVTTINTGGEKVYPAEVEEAIKAVPGVDDCLVLGVPDERFGQKVAALVVPEPGRRLVAADLTDAVRATLAGYKVPRHVRFVDEVPRLANGKVDYATAGGLACAESGAR